MVLCTVERRKEADIEAAWVASLGVSSAFMAALLAARRPDAVAKHLSGT